MTEKVAQNESLSSDMSVSREFSLNDSAPSDAPMV
jgi:hypothetical protein